jgi:membrane-associated protease RseP (regulator of RpoE activity)
MSDPLSALTTTAPSRFVVLFGSQPIWLGNSILFSALDGIFAGDGEILLLHPVAFAAWLGLFVTALNLFPLAQLDGGHILYALLGGRQRYFGMAFLAVLVGLGFFWWGWWLWAALTLVLGRGSIRHPSVFDPEVPVTGRRRLVGWFCVVIFLLTFAPIPIRL